MKKPPRDAEVTVDEAAKVFGCSRRAMLGYAERGMPHRIEKKWKRSGPRPMVVRLSDVEKWGEDNFIRALQRHPPREKPGPQPEVPEAGGATAEAAASGGQGQEPRKIEFGILAEVQRVRRVVYRAYQGVVLASKTNDPQAVRVATREYRELCDQLTRMEKAADARKEIEGELRSDFEGYVSRWAIPIRAYLDSLPRTMAPRFAPCDPGKAEKELRAEIEGKLLPMMAKALPTL